MRKGRERICSWINLDIQCKYGNENGEIYFRSFQLFTRQSGVVFRSQFCNIFVCFSVTIERKLTIKPVNSKDEDFWHPHSSATLHEWNFCRVKSTSHSFKQWCDERKRCRCECSHFMQITKKLGWDTSKVIVKSFPISFDWCSCVFGWGFRNLLTGKLSSYRYFIRASLFSFLYQYLERYNSNLSEAEKSIAQKLYRLSHSLNNNEMKCRRKRTNLFLHAQEEF